MEFGYFEDNIPERHEESMQLLLIDRESLDFAKKFTPGVLHDTSGSTIAEHNNNIVEMFNDVNDYSLRESLDSLSAEGNLYESDSGKDYDNFMSGLLSTYWLIAVNAMKKELTMPIISHGLVKDFIRNTNILYARQNAYDDDTYQAQRMQYIWENNPHASQHMRVYTDSQAFLGNQRAVDTYVRGAVMMHDVMYHHTMFLDLNEYSVGRSC